MTKTTMTLPNGDVLHDGDYGMTECGEVVGPLKSMVDGAWYDEGAGVGDDDGTGVCRDPDIIARAEPPVEKPDNIIPLHKPTGDLNRLVKVLEDAIALVRAGQIDGFAMAYTTPDDSALLCEGYMDAKLTGMLTIMASIAARHAEANMEEGG